MKKAISIFLSTIMIILACGPVSLAYTFDDNVLASGTDEDTMPVIKAVYMQERENAPADEIQFEETKIDYSKEIFYVGLKVSNFSKFNAMSNGMYSIAGGIVYDSKYVKPYETRIVRGNEVEVTTADQYNTALNNRFADEDGFTKMGENSFSYDASSYSSLYSVEAERAKPNESGYNSDIADPQVLQFTLSYYTDTEPPSRQVADDEYFIIFKFKLLNQPADPENFERKIMAISDATELNFQFGQKGASGDYSYRGTSTLEEYLKLDSSGVNIYPETFTVNYDANTANYPGAGFKDDVTDADKTEKVADGEKATLKNNNVEISSLLKDVPNKVFEGWYTNADPDNKGTKIDPTTDSAKITGPTTFFAHYTDGYKVTFNLNTDDATAKFFDNTTDQKEYKPVMDQPLIADGETLNDKIGGGDPTRTGYTFKGWYTKNNGSFVQKYEENDLKAALNKSIDLYARWEDNDDANKDFRINFDNNGGTGVDPTSVGYNTGDTLDDLIGGLPVEPTKDGYKFLGWYKNASGDGPRLKSDTVLSDYITDGSKNPGTTVYARWGDVTEPVDPDNPTPNPATAVTVHFEKDSTGDTYAGGTYDYVTVNDKYITLGDPVGPLPDGDTMHHTDTTKAFDGWYTQQTGGVKVEADQPLMDANLDGYTGLTAGQTVTLYPRWMDKLTVKYNANGLPATVTIPAQDTVNPNTSYTIKNITDSTGNYTLKEWVTKPDATTGNIEHYAPNDSITLTKSLDLYAVWDYNGPNAVTVVFNVNDTAQNAGTLNPNDDTANDTPAKTKTYTMTRQAGTSISEGEMPAATRTNYTFNHWNTNPAATPLDPKAQANIPVVAPATAGDPMNVYAIWEVTDKTTQIKIEFNTDGGTPSTIDPIYIVPNDSLGLKMPADPTKSGNDFGGWYIDTTDESTKKDKDSTFALDTTLKAKWVENIVIKYDLNGADTPASISDVTASASKVYVDPTPTPTKTGYKFLGWNTKKSGSGEYIAADTTTTYGQVAAKLGTDKTLYAQWAAVPDDKIPDVKDDDPVNPDNNAVHVIFNDNVPDNTPNKITTPTAPKNKYPKWDGKLDDVSMPDQPERTHYIFQGWNTKPDGSGKTIVGTTPVNNDEANFNGAIETINGETDKYQVTLYAQWTVNEDEVLEVDRRTLIFYNSSPDGKKGNEFKKIVVEKGEILGYDVAGPTNDVATFFAWAEADSVDGNGQITYKKNSGAFVTFNKDAVINDNMDYYATWNTYVALYLQGYDPDDANNTVDKLTYTGQAHKPKYDLRYIKYDDDTHQSYKPVGDVLETGIDPFDAASIVKVDYQKNGTTVTEIKDVGTYTIDQDTLALNSGNKYSNAGMTLVGAVPSALIVKEASLTVSVRAGEQADGQKQKKGQNTKTAITVTGMLNGEAQADVCDIEYYKINNNTATTISGDSDLTLVTETDPTKWDIGKYVIKVKPKANSNYKIGSVVADDKGGAVLFYEREGTNGYPSYPSMYTETTPGTFNLTVMGQNIVYDLVASDPEIADITLTGNTKYEPNPGDTPVPTTKPLELKDSDYTAAKPIQTSKPDSTNPDPDWDKHYVRVDKYNDSIDFEIGAKYPDTTTVTATYGKTGDTATPTQATVTQDPTTKKWKVNIPTSIKAPDTTTVTVTMTSGTDTREYTFVLQALVAPKIELAYGNSPYGEIMKATNIADADKAEAKRLFNENGKTGVEAKYSSADGGKYFPAGLEDRAAVTYIANAWVDVTDIQNITQAEQDAIADPNINMDRNDYAIFVYGDRQNEVELQDSGFKAYNSLGEEIDATQITRTITVQQYTESNGIAGNVETKTFVFENDIENGVTWAADAVLPGVTAWDKRAMRPDIYTLYYSFDDPADPAGGSAERKIIYVPKRYDTNVDLVVNGGDPTYTVSASKGKYPFKADTPLTTQRIYKFRVLDGNMDAVINGGDPIYTRSAAKGVSTGANYVQFYR